MREHLKGHTMYWVLLQAMLQIRIDWVVPLSY